MIECLIDGASQSEIIHSYDKLKYFEIYTQAGPLLPLQYHACTYARIHIVRSGIRMLLYIHSKSMSYLCLG